MCHLVHFTAKKDESFDMIVQEKNTDLQISLSENFFADFCLCGRPEGLRQVFLFGHLAFGHVQEDGVRLENLVLKNTRS